MVHFRKLAALVSLSLAICLLLMTTAARAQQTLGGITGTVVDPTGGAIPSVEVKAVVGRYQAGAYSQDQTPRARIPW